MDFDLTGIQRRIANALEKGYIRHDDGFAWRTTAAMQAGMKKVHVEQPVEISHRPRRKQTREEVELSAAQRPAQRKAGVLRDFMQPPNGEEEYSKLRHERHLDIMTRYPYIKLEVKPGCPDHEAVEKHNKEFTAYRDESAQRTATKQYQLFAEPTGLENKYDHDHLSRRSLMMEAYPSRNFVPGPGCPDADKIQKHNDAANSFVLPRTIPSTILSMVGARQ